MKPTGRFNQFTGEEIMQAEEHDITFWHKKWDELSDNERAGFISFLGLQFLGVSNKEYVRGWWEYYSKKNTMDL